MASFKILGREESLNKGNGFKYYNNKLESKEERRSKSKLGEWKMDLID